MKKTILAAAVAALTLNASAAMASVITETEGNDSFASAQSVDGWFSLDSSPNIFLSTDFAHASVSGSNGSATDVDYFRFTVTADDTVGFFDIDGAEGTGAIGASPYNLDTVMALFDANYNLLAFNHNSPLDPGSINSPYNTADSFIGYYLFDTAGTYYIGVSNSGSYVGALGTACPQGLIRPEDDLSGGTCYMGDSGPTSFVTNANSAYTSGTYTLHLSLEAPGQAAAVPEPASLSLLGIGLAGLGLRRRRKA